MNPHPMRDLPCILLYQVLTSYCLCQITANVAIEIREGGGPFSLVVKLAGPFYLVLLYNKDSPLVRDRVVAFGTTPGF